MPVWVFDSELGRISGLQKALGISRQVLEVSYPAAPYSFKVRDSFWFWTWTKEY
jgi:hypothetical protein